MAIGLFAQVSQNNVVVASVTGYETVEVVLTPGIYHIEVSGSVDILNSYGYYWCHGAATPVYYDMSDPSPVWVGINPVYWETSPFPVYETTTVIFSGAVEGDSEDNATVISSSAQLIRTAQISQH